MSGRWAESSERRKGMGGTLVGLGAAGDFCCSCSTTVSPVQVRVELEVVIVERRPLPRVTRGQIFRAGLGFPIARWDGAKATTQWNAIGAEVLPAYPTYGRRCLMKNRPASLAAQGGTPVCPPMLATSVFSADPNASNRSSDTCR